MNILIGGNGTDTALYSDATSGVTVSLATAAAQGGNVRVGLEDNLYLKRGQLATNAQLVERAAALLEAQNIKRLTAEDVRQKLGLVKHA